MADDMAIGMWYSKAKYSSAFHGTMLPIIRFAYRICYLRIFLGIFMLARAIGYWWMIAADYRPSMAYATQEALFPLWVWGAINAAFGLALMASFRWRREIGGRFVAALAVAFYTATVMSWVDAGAIPAAAYTIVICLALFVEATNVGTVEAP